MQLSLHFFGGRPGHGTYNGPDREREAPTIIETTAGTFDAWPSVIGIGLASNLDLGSDEGPRKT